MDNTKKKTVVEKVKRALRAVDAEQKRELDKKIREENKKIHIGGGKN